MKYIASLEGVGLKEGKPGVNLNMTNVLKLLQQVLLKNLFSGLNGYTCYCVRWNSRWGSGNWWFPGGNIVSGLVLHCLCQCRWTLGQCKKMLKRVMKAEGGSDAHKSAVVEILLATRLRTPQDLQLILDNRCFAGNRYCQPYSLPFQYFK